MPKIDIAKAGATQGSTRNGARSPTAASKTVLGEAAGPTQFGVNLTRLAGRRLGAAPLARGRGRIRLRAGRRDRADRGWRRNRAASPAMPRASRPAWPTAITSSTNRQDALYLESARAKASARIIPTSIWCWIATSTVRFSHRSGAPIRRSREPMDQVNFKLDVDADGIALVTWDMPARSMNVIDQAVIDELAPMIVEQGRRPTPRSRARSSPPARTRSAPAPISPCWRRSAAGVRDSGMARRRGEPPRPPVRGEPQAVAALSADRDLRQAVGGGDQRHCARRRLRACLACHHRVAADNPQDPRGPAGDQGRAVPRRRRHATGRAHDAAGRRAAVPAQGRSARARRRPRR